MQPSAVFKTLQILGISRVFVYRVIDRYNDTLEVDDRQRSGRPRTVHSQEAIAAVQSIIRQNPVLEQNILSLAFFQTRS